MYMRKCNTMMAGCLGGMRMDLRESGGRKSPSLLIIAMMAAVALTAETVGLLTDVQPWLENPSTNLGWFLTQKCPQWPQTVQKPAGSFDRRTLPIGRIKHVHPRETIGT
jgi:hypothetical protein